MMKSMLQRFTGGSSLRGAEYRFVAIVLAPTLLFYLVIKFYPIFFAFFISLHEWSLFGGDPPFVAFDNYAVIS